MIKSVHKDQVCIIPTMIALDLDNDKNLYYSSDFLSLFGLVRVFAGARSSETS